MLFMNADYDSIRWVRKLPGLKGQNSIFDLPELYDE